MNGLVGGPLLVGGMGPLNPALLIVVLGTGARAKGKNMDIAVRSLTCHTATGTHMPYRITQRSLPPDRADIPAFTPAEALPLYTFRRLSDPGGIQG